mmetsp:Transcript_27233/g.63685  ORF Transcript_27233/g.63685 Transcript_27233/m.63685 type:complete len:129 (+) Transcript_27233:252-638(+)
MLRYSMGHRLAAEATSLPAAAAAEENTVLSFCSTRWNQLQEGHADWTEGEPPSSADCLSFALSHPSVGGVLHSARDEEELRESLSGLRYKLRDDERRRWERYGALPGWGAGFDEYPEEEAEAARAGAR